LYDDADAADNYVNEIGGAEDINYNQTITNPLDPAYFDEEDAALNGLHNYHYDAIGNLIHDEREQIQAIEWTLSGKVRSVSRTTSSTRKPLSFAYGAGGQRILKTVSDPDLDVTGSREHYIRDAQGNILATYRFSNAGSASLTLNDRPIYGSSRLGAFGEEKELHSLLNWDPADPVIVDQVDLNYELTDHLGNVCTVVTGRLLDGNGGGTLKQPELVAAQRYEPFGSLLPGRNYSSGSYRHLFQGQEHNDEINGGVGLSYAFEYRMHDPRVGKFLSIDPLAFLFPWNSPYAFSENRVLDMVELEGLEAAPTEDKVQAMPEMGETRPDGSGGVYSGAGDEHFGASQGGSTYRPEGWYDDFSPAPTTPSNPTPSAPKAPASPRPTGGGLRGPTISQGRPNIGLNYTKPSSLFSNPWVQRANDVNTVLGIGTGLGSGMFGYTSKPAPFRYAQNVNGVTRSAPVLTRAHTLTSLRAAANLSKLNVITSVLSTGYTLGKINSDYQRGGWSNVYNWDIADATVGVGGLAASGAVYLGLISNPVGWGIGIGVSAYYGARFLYEYTKDE